MSRSVERSAEWIYRGIWRVLVQCFHVPQGPPTLPAEIEESLRVFHPSRKYLSYLRAYFWVGLVVIDLAILVGWIALLFVNAWLAWLLAIPALLVAVLPDIVAYIAIHLRYDTIWYGVSNRGLYVRRGIIVITEHTITLENIQNISLRRGPLEQLFGIATVVVETAGASAGEEENVFTVGNKTIMVGLADAEQICALLLNYVRRSTSAGLGDEIAGRHEGGWTSDDRELLASIRDEVRLLAQA